MDAIDKLQAAVNQSSQTKVGEVIGCGQGLLSRWLSRAVIPSGLYADKLVRYGITSDDLVSLKVGRKPKLSKRRRRTAARRRAA